MPANSTLCLSWVPGVPWMLKCIRCLYFKIRATRTPGAAPFYRVPLAFTGRLVLSLCCEWERNGRAALVSFRRNTSAVCKARTKGSKVSFHGS